MLPAFVNIGHCLYSQNLEEMYYLDFMPNLAKCYQTQTCQKYTKSLQLTASRECIRKHSCHLRDFRAIVDVVNNNKSV